MPEAKKEQVLSVRDLDITFKTTAGQVHAIRSVNIDLYKGETVALVGESGSGKSVTSLSVMRLLPGASARVSATANSFFIQHSPFLICSSSWEARRLDGASQKRFPIFSKNYEGPAITFLSYGRWLFVYLNSKTDFCQLLDFLPLRRHLVFILEYMVSIHGLMVFLFFWVR